jgi:hypothetical protein
MCQECKRQAGDTEVTPEMIEAGLRVWDAYFGSMDEHQLLRRAYIAMRAVEAGQRPSQSG